MPVFKSAILEVKTSKHLCGYIICLVTCPKKYIQWSAYIWMCIWNIKYFIHSKIAGSPHKTLPWASEMVLAAWPAAYLYLLKGTLGLQLFDCWGLMEYKTCEYCVLLNLEFSFFALSLETGNSPNEMRQTGVRMWAEHFLLPHISHMKKQQIVCKYRKYQLHLWSILPLERLESALSGALPICSAACDATPLCLFACVWFINLDKLAPVPRITYVLA